MARALLLPLLLLLAPSVGNSTERNAVTDCHADPSGATDSTLQLVRCHASGDRVFYPEGEYRLNAPTLDLSGGVRFASRSGVVVHNNISSESILQLDDAGRLIGLQQNHLERSDLATAAPMTVGSLVPPPLSSAPTPGRAQVLGLWYNDGGLETRRANPGSGWLGWYYWTWAFHGGYPRGNRSLATRYDPARKPLLGFYRGDDATVLDWQCFWLREYGVTGVILIGGVPPCSDPASPAFWQWQVRQRHTQSSSALIPIGFIDFQTKTGPLPENENIEQRFVLSCAVVPPHAKLPAAKVHHDNARR
jgi:hypothetical protein